MKRIILELFLVFAVVFLLFILIAFNLTIGDGYTKLSPDGNWEVTLLSQDTVLGSTSRVSIKLYKVPFSSNDECYWSYRYDHDNSAISIRNEIDIIKWKPDSSGFVMMYRDKINDTEGIYKFTFDISSKYFTFEGPFDKEEMIKWREDNKLAFAKTLKQATSDDLDLKFVSNDKQLTRKQGLVSLDLTLKNISKHNILLTPWFEDEDGLYDIQSNVLIAIRSMTNPDSCFFNLCPDIYEVSNFGDSFELILKPGQQINITAEVIMNNPVGDYEILGELTYNKNIKASIKHIKLTKGKLFRIEEENKAEEK